MHTFHHVLIRSCELIPFNVLFTFRSFFASFFYQEHHHNATGLFLLPGTQRSRSQFVTPSTATRSAFTWCWLSSGSFPSPFPLPLPSEWTIRSAARLSNPPSVPSTMRTSSFSRPWGPSTSPVLLCCSSTFGCSVRYARGHDCRSFAGLPRGRTAGVPDGLGAIGRVDRKGNATRGGKKALVSPARAGLCSPAWRDWEEREIRGGSVRVSMKPPTPYVNGRGSTTTAVSRPRALNSCHYRLLSSAAELRQHATTLQRWCRHLANVADSRPCLRRHLANAAKTIGGRRRWATWERREWA